jgi:hypothetical protein
MGIVKAMHCIVLIITKEVIFATRFLAMGRDEVTMVDNQSWVNIKAYLVDDFKCISILLTLEKLIDNGIIDNLTTMILNFLPIYGDLIIE